MRNRLKKTKRERKSLKEIKDVKEMKTKVSWREKLKLNRNPSKTFFVTMMYNNGTCKTFVMKGEGNYFTHSKKTYYIDYEESWFNLTQNQYFLLYNENYAVPINREVQPNGDEAFFNVTPSNLKEVVKMEYIKVLAQSQELSKWLRLSLLISGIGIFLTLVLTFLIYSLSKNLGFKIL